MMSAVYRCVPHWKYDEKDVAQSGDLGDIGYPWCLEIRLNHWEKQTHYFLKKWSGSKWWPSLLRKVDALSWKIKNKRNGP